MSSIISRIEEIGAVLDSNLARTLRCFVSESTEPSFIPRKTFSLAKPYILDECSSVRAQKKRKLWETHQDATDPNLAESIIRAHKELVQLARGCCLESLFSEPDNPPQMPLQCPKLVLCVSESGDTLIPQVPNQESSDQYRILKLAASLSSRQDRLVELGSRQYVVPEGSSFYMGDIRQGITTIEENLVPASGFRLAIVDPPWQSKSRGKKVLAGCLFI